MLKNSIKHISSIQAWSMFECLSFNIAYVVCLILNLRRSDYVHEVTRLLLGTFLP